MSARKSEAPRGSHLGPTACCYWVVLLCSQTLTGQADTARACSLALSLVPISGLSGLLVAMVMCFFLPQGWTVTQVCLLQGFLGKLYWELLVGAATCKLECSGRPGCSAPWVRKADGADLQRGR